MMANNSNTQSNTEMKPLLGAGPAGTKEAQTYSSPRRRTGQAEGNVQGDGCEEDPNEGTQGERCSPLCCLCIWTYYLAVCTTWAKPIEMAKYITGYQDHVKWIKMWLLHWIYMGLRLLLGIVGLIAQTLSCFRRDRLDKDLVQETNSSKTVECREPSQVLSAFIIPDLIIGVLLFYISFSVCFPRCCRNPSNQDEPEDEPEDELYKRIYQLKRPGKCKSIFWSIIFPFSYVFFSLGVSILNMYAFEIVEFHDRTVINWKVFQISGPLKRALIVMSFLGFVALDLFYIELIMKYAFQCQMNIFYVEIIIDKVTNANNNNRYASQEAALQDVAMAHKFFKQLNESSCAVGFIILIIALQAINCIVSLLSSGNSWIQALALAFRLIQWVTLPLITIYQAAKTNGISIELCETGLAMYRPPVEFNGTLTTEIIMKHTYPITEMIIVKHTYPITLKAKIFGFTIHPWFFYVIVILILFSLMVGSFEWFERLHVL